MIFSHNTFSKLYFQNTFKYFGIIQYFLYVHPLELLFLFVIMLVVNDNMWSEESENHFTAWLSNYCEILIIIFCWFRVILQTILIVFYPSLFVLKTTGTFIISWIHVNPNILVINHILKIINHLSLFIYKFKLQFIFFILSWFKALQNKSIFSNTINFDLLILLFYFKYQLLRII